MSTISTENYLKTIFNHSNASREKLTAIKLAQKLSVSSAAISDMAKRLSDQGLISYEKYKGMELTKEGEKIALKVVRKHRLWESFLIKVLNMPLSQVHDEAERLEHHTTDFLIDKIEEYLDYPEFDPHGHPIPKKDGTIPKTSKFLPLADAKSSLKYRLMQFDDRDNKLIDYLFKVGLVIGTEFEVIDRLDYDNSITVKFNSKTLSLSKKITNSVYVKPV